MDIPGRENRTGTSIEIRYQEYSEREGFINTIWILRPGKSSWSLMIIILKTSAKQVPF